jgi:hypothetical protein
MPVSTDQASANAPRATTTDPVAFPRVKCKTMVANEESDHPAASPRVAIRKPRVTRIEQPHVITDTVSSRLQVFAYHQVTKGTATSLLRSVFKPQVNNDTASSRRNYFKFFRNYAYAIETKGSSLSTYVAHVNQLKSSTSFTTRPPRQSTQRITSKPVLAPQLSASSINQHVSVSRASKPSQTRQLLPCKGVLISTSIKLIPSKQLPAGPRASSLSIRPGTTGAPSSGSWRRLATRGADPNPRSPPHNCCISYYHRLRESTWL